MRKNLKVSNQLNQGFRAILPLPGFLVNKFLPEDFGGLRFRTQE